MPVQSLQTVENAMVVLETVAENQPIGVSALARLLDMDKNTAQRLLVTLGRQGWISQDGPKGSWSLTGRVIKVAARVSWRMAERARPLMSSLLASTQESVTLWKLDGQPGTWWCTLVDIIESPHALRMGVPMGTTFDLNSTPGSRYDVQPHLTRFPDGRTAWGTPRVDQAPRYWVHDRSYPSAMTIGSIIYDGPGPAIGTLAVLGPKTRIDPSRHHIIGEEVATAARLISGL